MDKPYHSKIMTQALEKHFSKRAFDTILRANLRQDNLRGQIGHPEFHFDDNGIDQGNAYIAQQYEIIHAALADGSLVQAWEAFGRLTHAAQDFYAHSNYVKLWLDRSAQGLNPADIGSEIPLPEVITPSDPIILESPDLITGRIYLPWEILSFLGLAPLMRRLLPGDSHTSMNLDNPRQGALFPYAMVAARKRTVGEFENLRAEL